MVLIYERPGMPAPQNTTLGFNLPPDQFDAVAADLRARGVTFEDYDIPEIGLKTVNGIAEFEGAKAAWFKQHCFWQKDGLRRQLVCYRRPLTPG